MAQPMGFSAIGATERHYGLTVVVVRNPVPRRHFVADTILVKVVINELVRFW